MRIEATHLPTWPFQFELLYDVTNLLHAFVGRPKVNCLPKGVHGVLASLSRKQNNGSLQLLTALFGRGVVAATAL